MANYKDHEFPELELMRMGVDCVGSIQLRDFKVRIRPLSSHEYVQVAHEVAEDIQRMPQSARTALMEHYTLAKRILIKASTSDVGANDSKLSEPLLNRMTMNEVIALFKEYTSFEEKVNPVLDKMEPDKLMEMVEYLKKSLGEVTTLSFNQLVNVATFFLTKGD